MAGTRSLGQCLNRHRLAVGFGRASLAVTVPGAAAGAQAPPRGGQPCRRQPVQRCAGRSRVLPLPAAWSVAVSCIWSACCFIPERFEDGQAVSEDEFYIAPLLQTALASLDVLLHWSGSFPQPQDRELYAELQPSAPEPEQPYIRASASEAARVARRCSCFCGHGDPESAVAEAEVEACEQLRAWTETTPHGLTKASAGFS